MVFKYLIVILIIVGIQSCTPSDYRDPRNRCEWYVTNLTKDSLLIKTTFSYESVILIQDTTILIDHTAFQKHSNEIFFQGIYNFNVIDDSVVVCNMKGDELIVWTESDGMTPVNNFSTRSIGKSENGKKENMCIMNGRLNYFRKISKSQNKMNDRI